MPNINATKYVNALGTMTQNFSTARESDGNSHTDNSTSSNIGIVQFFRDSGKGATNYRFRRYFSYCCRKRRGSSFSIFGKV